MTWWTDLKRKASDLLSEADDEVRRRQKKLDASPAERVDMLLGEIEEEDRRIERMEERLSLRSTQPTDSPPSQHGRRGEPNDGGERAELGDGQAAEASQEADAAPSTDIAIREIDGEFNYAVEVDEIGGKTLESLADEIRMHLFVIDTAVDAGSILLRAPTLTADEVSRIVSAARAT